MHFAHGFMSFPVNHRSGLCHRPWLSYGSLGLKTPVGTGFCEFDHKGGPLGGGGGGLGGAMGQGVWVGLLPKGP